MAKTYGAERGLGRFEAFSDAVFGIALTLLITEIKPPGAPQGPHVGASLAEAMAGQWREHLALLLGFAAIGVYWLQHHYSGRIYDRSDHVFGLINLLFLLTIIVLPYPLRVWAFHVGTPHEATAAISLTAGLAAVAIMWMGKWFYGLSGDRRVMDDRLAPDFLRQMTRRYGLAAALQVAALPLAILSPRLGVALALAIILFFAFPQPTPRYRPGQEPDEAEKTNA